jgi:flagellar biosynthetic protein FliR
MPWNASGLDWVWVLGHLGGWLLVLARVTGVCVTAPVLAAPGLELRFRLGLSLLLTIVIAPLVPVSPGMTHWSATVWSVLAELLTGATLGWSAGLIVGGAQLAGDLVGSQSGLSAATFFDPESGEELTAMGRLYGWIAIAVFLSLDGPLLLVESMVQSYQAIPAGGLGVSRGSVLSVFSELTRVLELALRAAAPPAVALVVAGLAMGWLSRAAPSFPLVALTLPVRAMLGIVLVVLGVSSLAFTLASAWQALLEYG